LSFTLAFVAGAIGVVAMIAGAVMLARETRFSFRILQEETKVVSQRVHDRAAKLVEAGPAKKL
jgi:hypothetical protein